PASVTGTRGTSTNHDDGGGHPPRDQSHVRWHRCDADRLPPLDRHRCAPRLWLSCCGDVAASPHGSRLSPHRRLSHLRKPRVPTYPPLDLPQELRRLSRLHRDIGAWFQTQAARHPIADHVDGLFVDLIYRGQARRFFRWSKELDQWPAVRHLDEEDLVASYRWLVSL